MSDDSAADGTEITELEPIASDDEDDERLHFNDDMLTVLVLA